MDLIGALVGTAVAQTIASGLVETSIVTSRVLICALLGAILWNLLTWWFGLPSSSSHALIGSLCGAALAAAHGNWSVIIWSQTGADHWWHNRGILWKVILPMIFSPICGFVLGFFFMAFLYVVLRPMRPMQVNRIFGKLQILSSAAVGFMHGTNDAQKTMGIIALALLAGTTSGAFNDLPGWLHFLRTPEPPAGQSIEIAIWIKVVCALTMSLGTASGGWRIIKTLGRKLVKLQPISGFAAQTSSALVILFASRFGIPVSTTHNTSAAVMGVGAAKRFNSIKWHVVERMVWAWILTLPVCALFSFTLFELTRFFAAAN
jgi:PiT family inorganic phosphate transporter